LTKVTRLCVSLSMQTFDYTATTFAGLEPLLADELRLLGAEDIRPGRRNVQFKGDLRLLYRANYECRLALRILRPLLQFRAKNPEVLYKKVKSFDWSMWFDAESSFRIDQAVRSSYFSHSQFAVLKVKDAIVDHFRERTGERPNIEREFPDFQFHLYIGEDKVIISADSTGEPLFKRGYRTGEAHTAPLNEVLAAGIIQQAGWFGQSRMMDPMCGSGTLLIEAASLAMRRPSQFLRYKYAFQKWKNYQKQVWENVRREADAQALDSLPEDLLLGRDSVRKNIALARENVKRAGFEDFIHLESRNFFVAQPPTPTPEFILTNPPYGQRIGEEQEMDAFYAKMGETLKQKYTPSTAAIFSANLEALKAIGLRPRSKYPLYNGPNEARLWVLELYDGTRRKTKSNAEDEQPS